MPLDWRAYEEFDWANARQAPLDTTARAALTDFAADLLDLASEQRASIWGAASPPGRFAATVIHVLPEIPQRYLAKILPPAAPQKAENPAVGLKIFKATADAQREGRRALLFHREQIHRLPGLPNGHTQQSFDAGVVKDNHGAEIFFVVQEWVAGETLENLLRRRWPPEPPDAARVRSILTQLFTNIVIPLWSAGTVWWDVRDANYCYAAETNTLKMIDVDSLAAYANEILNTPAQWTQRDKGRSTALARLRQMTLRHLQSSIAAPRKKIEIGLREAWQAELEPALLTLGKTSKDQTTPTSPKDALCAFQRFMECLRDENLFTD